MQDISTLDKGCDYFVFHDVDMLAEDVDYSYSDKPLHLQLTYKNTITKQHSLITLVE